MNHTATLVLNRSYMNESFDQFRRYGSKWRLIEIAIGAAFIVFGIALLIWASGKTLLPLVVVAIGVFELMCGRIKKFFWMRRHLKSKLNDAHIELVFGENGIDSRGPFSEGRMTWNGIEKTVRTPNGIIIWPQNGMYTYLPESVIGVDAIEYVQKKVT